MLWNKITIQEPTFDRIIVVYRFFCFIVYEPLLSGKLLSSNKNHVFSPSNAVGVHD